ncbi:MAG: hypothetical protein ABJD68_15965, partial [Nakamurella sp.]
MTTAAAGHDRGQDGNGTPHPMQRLIDSLAGAGGRRASAWESAGREWDSAEQFNQILAVLRADHADAAKNTKKRLRTVSKTFGLRKVECGLLFLAAATDLDANVGLAFAQLRGLTGVARPTISLALELVAVPTAGAASFALLGPSGELRRSRLLDVSDAEPWLGRLLSVPPSVAAVLAGGRPCDPVVARLRTAVVPLVLPGTATVARAIGQGVGLTWVRSPAGSSGASLAAGAFAELSRTCLSIDVRRHLPSLGMADVLTAAAREAGLVNSGLLVIGAEALAEPLDYAAFEAMDRAAVPVVAVGSRPWNPAWLARLPLLIDAEPLLVSDRAAIWRDSLGEFADQDELRESLPGLRLTADEVSEAARYARLLATTGDGVLSIAAIREAARRIGGSGLGGNSAPPGSGPTFDDLVLPPHTAAELRRLVSWAQ